jgi:hypothetical protein
MRLDQNLRQNLAQSQWVHQVRGVIDNCLAVFGQAAATVLDLAHKHWLGLGQYE